MLPDRVILIPEGGLVLEDPASPYRERIAQLEYELEKARRGKKHILRQLSGNSG
jgi:hypothetical protein